jgi:putative protein kinase ArgK-like GTPase of G3E family
MTKASLGEGVDEVLEAAFRHRDFRREHPQRDRTARRLRAEVMEICEEEVMRRLVAAASKNVVREVLSRVSDGKEDPYNAALEILEDRGELATILSTRVE